MPASVRVTPTSRTAAPGLTLSRGDQPGNAGRGDDDVGAAQVARQVAGAGVAQGHGRVLGAPGQQQAERPADGDPAADDDDLRAGDRHVVAPEQLDDAAPACTAAGPARPSTRRPRLVGCRPSASLAGSIRSRTAPASSPARQRQLDDVAGAGRVGVELVDDGLDVGLGGGAPAARAGAERCRPRRSRGACRRRRSGCPGRRPPARVPSPGTTPWSRRAATRSFSSDRIAAAVALPSRIVALTVGQSGMRADHADQCGGR